MSAPTEVTVNGKIDYSITFGSKEFEITMNDIDVHDKLVALYVSKQVLVDLYNNAAHRPRHQQLNKKTLSKLHDAIKSVNQMLHLAATESRDEARNDIANQGKSESIVTTSETNEQNNGDDNNKPLEQATT